MADNTPKNDPLKAMLGLSDNDTEGVISDMSAEPKRPDLRHAFARSALGIKLTYADPILKNASADWCILDQPKIQIKQHDLIPDLAAWQHEELHDKAVIECVPDWIGEVLRSSARQDDQHFNMPLYAKLGVKHFWLINPNWHTLEAYQLENQSWNLIASYKDDDKVSEAPFDAISFPLSNLWSND